MPENTWHTTCGDELVLPIAGPWEGPLGVLIVGILPGPKVAQPTVGWCLGQGDESPASTSQCLLVPICLLLITQDNESY